MENNKGILTHFGGLIRVIILIILVALITFFTVRWVRNRNDTKKAEQAGQTAQSEGKEGNSIKDTDKEKSDSSNNSNSSGTQLPSGIADSSLGADSGNTNQTVPAAGMDSNIIVTAVFLGLTAYLVTKNYQIVLQKIKQ